MRELKLKSADGQVTTFYLNEDQRMFTGLLDKNGKEIYEGDILANNGSKAFIHFQDGAFVVGEYGVPLKQFAGENKEVIGNILEPRIIN